MAKTFTVQEIQHKEVSPGKGSIVWLLSDEQGLPRKVNAITDIAANGVVDKMRPVYKRETPLVERLHYLNEGQTFTLDFSGYNQQENYAPREIYTNMRSIEKVGSLATGFTRVVMLGGLLLVCWLAYGLFTDVMQMQLNLASTTRLVE